MELRDLQLNGQQTAGRPKRTAKAMVAVNGLACSVTAHVGARR